MILGASIRHNITLPFVRKLRKGLFIDGSKEHSIAREYIDFLKVKTPDDETSVVNLSGGNQQKVSLAKWMPADAKVVIFDQPTVGIDVKAKTEIYRLMEDLAERGLGIILITNEVEEALNISDRLLIMANKKIVAEVDPSKTTASEVLANALG